MIYKKTLSEKIFDFVNYFLMVLVAVLCLYPLLYVVFSSLSDPLLLVTQDGILLHPMGFTLKGYELVCKNPNILMGYINTFFYVIAGTFINVIFTAMSAYVLSHRNLYWKKALTVIVVFTMFFSGGLIPFFLQVKNLGLYNSRLALILPSAIVVWNLIIMRTAFLSIPNSLEESARIDGAGDFTILFRIVIPLSAATIAVITLFYAVGHWNSWFSAMIFLRNRNKYPLQLVLREILIANDTSSMTVDEIGLNSANDDKYRVLVQYATTVVATIPILCIYPYLQKYFIKGVMIGSLKG